MARPELCREAGAIAGRVRRATRKPRLILRLGEGVGARRSPSGDPLAARSACASPPVGPSGVCAGRPRLGRPGGSRRLRDRLKAALTRGRIQSGARPHFRQSRRECRNADRAGAGRLRSARSVLCVGLVRRGRGVGSARERRCAWPCAREDSRWRLVRAGLVSTVPRVRHRAPWCSKARHGKSGD